MFSDTLPLILLILGLYFTQQKKVQRLCHFLLYLELK